MKKRFEGPLSGAIKAVQTAIAQDDGKAAEGLGRVEMRHCQLRLRLVSTQPDGLKIELALSVVISRKYSGSRHGGAAARGLSVIGAHWLGDDVQPHRRPRREN
jgi:hypothetical protein